ncbi:unnamed protein product [Schistosoma intercalatum]|nr:unnamed protein product [Schistosoma intercalatum]CAH8497423.1 unnamed protein product [Schistosoma intercalatum]
MRNSSFYITKSIVYECLSHSPFRRCNFSSDSGDSKCLTKPRYKWAVYGKRTRISFCRDGQKSCKVTEDKANVSMCQ